MPLTLVEINIGEKSVKSLFPCGATDWRSGKLAKFLSPKSPVTSA
jgi:hypothetical protein